MMWWRWAGTAILALGISAATPRAHDPISTKVTWAREISSILERRCVSCHTQGGFGVFPFTTYEEARPWAVAMKEEVLAGHMPPWGAAPGIGQFANDRRLTRHEIELIAAWVDGGAPRGTADATLRPPRTDDGTLVPLANAVISAATERAASVTLQLPAGLTLTRWTFEPGTPAVIERADLELGSRWLGTWTPGERSIDFPADAGVPLGTSALFTARIVYRAPAEGTIDQSRLRLWLEKETRPKTIREGTIVRSWRPAGPVDLVAVRPARDAERVEVIARFATGRIQPVAMLQPPHRSPHPMYRLARPLSLPAGARVDVTSPVRLLYSAGATRTVKPNVRRRPRR